MFNEHGIAAEHNEFVLGLIKELGKDLHSYIQYGNTPMPSEAGVCVCVCVCVCLCVCVCVLHLLRCDSLESMCFVIPELVPAAL